MHMQTIHINLCFFSSLFFIFFIQSLNKNDIKKCEKKNRETFFCSSTSSLLVDEKSSAALINEK